MTMLKSFAISFIVLSLLIQTSTPSASIARTPTVILVEKKSNTLKVAEYVEGNYRTLKEYPAIFGQVKGDKVDEGDLKTPEGIYQFNARLTPPAIRPKFGAMALYMTYPNAWDRIADATGNDIMLHATNEPSRLKKGLDSKGCIVVNNEQILEIQEHVRLGLTPILVFDELSGEYLHPEGDNGLKQFFEQWVKSWNHKEINPYIDSYHSEFESDGKNRNAWRAYKQSLNNRYGEIRVRPENIMYFRHPKYSMIQFVQNYESTFKSGQIAHKSSGTKTLLVAEEGDQYRIIEERYTPQKW